MLKHWRGVLALAAKILCQCLGKSEKREVVHFGSASMACQAGAEALRRSISLPVGEQAFGLKVGLGLGLQWIDIANALEEELDFGLAIFWGPIIWQSAGGDQFLKDELLCEGTFEMGEESIALQKQCGRQVAHRPEESDIMGVKLERGEIRTRMSQLFPT